MNWYKISQADKIYTVCSYCDRWGTPLGQSADQYIWKLLDEMDTLERAEAEKVKPYMKNYNKEVAFSHGICDECWAKLEAEDELV